MYAYLLSAVIQLMACSGSWTRLSSTSKTIIPIFGAIIISPKKKHGIIWQRNFDYLVVLRANIHFQIPFPDFFSLCLITG